MMIDIQEEQNASEERVTDAMRTYTTAQMIEALGIKEARFYELKKKYHLFQEKGVVDGRHIVFGQDILDRYKEELTTFNARVATPSKEAISPALEQEPVQQEETIVKMITMSHEQRPLEPLHALDPIEQAILTLQKSKQQIFEQQEMIKVVRAIRERHVALLKEVDAFLERWD